MISAGVYDTVETVDDRMEVYSRTLHNPHKQNILISCHRLPNCFLCYYKFLGS